jgi:hypothetical protein
VAFKTLVVAKSGNQGVGGLGVECGVLILEELEAHADLESERLGERHSQSRLVVLAGPVGG